MDIIKIDRARVTKNGVEKKIAKSGVEYATFTVLWSSSKKDQNDQWEHGPTKFLRVTCFGDLAQMVAATIQPEMNVSLVGKLEHHEWMSQGGPKDDWQLTADLVSPARSSGGQRQQQGGGFQQQAPQQGGFQQQGDPWGGAPQGGFSQQPTQDEPPF